MSFSVTIQPSGREFDVEEGEVVLDAALKSGIAFPYGCRGGVCGSCLGTIISGSVDYPDGLPMSLDEEEAKEGQALFCQAVALSDLELDVPEIKSASEIQIKKLPARVESLNKLSHDVMQLKLKLPQSERLRFIAGQYIDFLLNDGRRRSFSLANAPFDDQFLELHLRHVPGGHFTDHVFLEMKEKALVRIEGPHGQFHIDMGSSRPLILVGGGTGFAPLKAMLEQLLEEGLTRPVHLYWGARGKADLYLNELAMDWAKNNKLVNYIPVLSEPKDEDDWQGRTGFVHLAVAADFPDLSEYEVYVSGPPPLVEAGRLLFNKQKLPDSQFFSDAFDYSQDALKAAQESS